MTQKLNILSIVKISFVTSRDYKMRAQKKVKSEKLLRQNCYKDLEVGKEGERERVIEKERDI